MNDLHAAIMNLPCKYEAAWRTPAPSDWIEGYVNGHRDTRFDAAELVAAAGVNPVEAKSIDAEIYSALACAAFAIKCLRDGIDIGEKLPDTVHRIESLLARGESGLHAARDAVVLAAQKWGDTDADDELAGLTAEFELSEALTAKALASPRIATTRGDTPSRDRPAPTRSAPY